MSSPANSIRFILDDQVVTLDFSDNGSIRPDTSLLNYLRNIGHTSVKEGCGEGDCGACTVVIASPEGKELKYKAVNSCLVFLPMVHGCQVITTENLSYRKDGKLHLHPVQQALVDHHGSQCGYCTPGIVMSLFALWKDHNVITESVAKERLAGNLCRCTGYQPILEAIMSQSKKSRHDHLSKSEEYIKKELQSIRESDNDIEIKKDDITYFKPGSVKSTLRIKADHPEAAVISGATDIAVAVNKRKQKINTYLDISSLHELQYVLEEGDITRFGVCISLEEMGKWTEKRFPALHEIIKLFGSHQIRNLATPGGNIASASPIGDLLPVLMAYDCKLELQNLKRSRKIPLEEFITGYHETRLNKDELITALHLPLPKKNKIIRSYKVSKRKDVDISTVSAGFCLSLDKDRCVQDIKLFYGGMAAYILRAFKGEKFLKGKLWTEDNAIHASGIVRKEFKPISDARSTAESRRIMAGNILIKFWEDSIKTTDDSKK